MILVTLGSQKFQFDRLLKEIDRLIENKYINGEDVFAQSGYSEYVPKHYRSKQFLNKDEFDRYMDEAKIVITHGGTGAIVGAIKRNKKVIAVPRLSQYGEHVDDHQIEIIDQLTNSNYIIGIKDTSELNEALSLIDNKEFEIFMSTTKNILESIEAFIDGE